MIDGSEKRNCEGGFWTLEFACLWKSEVKRWVIYLSVPSLQKNWKNGSEEENKEKEEK